MGFKILRKKRF